MSNPCHTYHVFRGCDTVCLMKPQPGPAMHLTGEDGPYRYMAPEIFRREIYTKKVDVYSFAMICYLLFEGKLPLSNLSPEEAARSAAETGSRPDFGEVSKGTFPR